MSKRWECVVILLISLLAIEGKDIPKKVALENEVVKAGDGVVRDAGHMRDILMDMRSRQSQVPDLAERRLMEVALEYLRPHRDLVHHQLLKLMPDSAPTNARYRTEVNDFIHLLTRADSSEICLTCIASVTVLKSLAEQYTDFDEVEQQVVEFCNTFMGELGENMDEVCVGIVALQGLHLFHIMKHDDVTPRGFCESQVSCIPDYVPRAPIANRQVPRMAAKPGTQTRQTYTDTIRVVQLTDIHINTLYAEGSPSHCGLPVCCRETYSHVTNSTATAGPYGDYRCNLPISTLQTMLDKVVELDPHLVVYTGDSAPHSMWNETLESQLNCTAIIAHEIGNKLPNTSVYATIGNHDFHPTNLYGNVTFPNGPDMAQISATMGNVTGHLWAPLGDFTQTQMDTMVAGGYYSINTHIPRLRILSFNTDTDMYSSNMYATLNENNPMNVQMKAHAENMLQDAQRLGEKVIVLFHHPVGGSSILRSSRWWHNIVIQYSDTIVLQMAGHTHTDHFRVFRDPSNGEARGVMFISPSLTPMPHINPSLRVYHLNATTLEVVDFDQYNFNILEPSPKVEFNYQAKAEYGLNDISPASWIDLIERFRTNDPLYEKFFNHRYADSYVPPRICDEICKIKELCSLANVNADDYQDCLELYLPTEAPSTVPTAPPTTAPTIAPTSAPVFCAGSRVTYSTLSLFIAIIFCLKH